jgi:hypothetical protein
MKFRIAPAATLSLLISLAGLAAAQDPTSNLTPPPIRMGLWQSSVTVDMSAMSGMPAGAPSGSMTHVNQSCMTPDTWKNAFHSMQQRQQQAQANCSTANVQQDAHQLTVDMDCSMQQGYSSNIHVQMFLDSDSAMHGHATVKMSGPSFPQGMSMSSAISSKFVSSDCGDVKPGESKPVHP